MSTTPAPEDIHVWQLYVELEDVRPKVWRRLLVPLTVDLSRLHVMLLWGTRGGMAGTCMSSSSVTTITERQSQGGSSPTT